MLNPQLEAPESSLELVLRTSALPYNVPGHFLTDGLRKDAQHTSRFCHHILSFFVEERHETSQRKAIAFLPGFLAQTGKKEMSYGRHSAV